MNQNNEDREEERTGRTRVDLEDDYKDAITSRVHCIRRNPGIFDEFMVLSFLCGFCFVCVRLGIIS